MPDREKVIKEWETVLSRDPLDAPWDLIDDTLTLLKEQETKLICNLLGGQPYEVYCQECRTMLCILGKGETMNDVKSIFSYCPHCGKRVKWE